MRKTKGLWLFVFALAVVSLAAAGAAQAATLSGTVYGDGNAFTAGSTYVVVYGPSSTGCSATFYTFGEVAGDGAFQIAALPPSPDINSKYFLKTWSTMPYVDEWFSADGQGSYDCQNAEGFYLSDVDSSDSRDIILAKGQNITGSVTGNTGDMTDKTYVLALKQVNESDGCSSPIYSISALDPKASSSGNYDTDMLVPGTYFLRTYSVNSYLSYYLKSDGTSTPNCTDAGAIVTDTSGTAITGKNFSITNGGGATVSGTVYYNSSVATDEKILINVYKYATYTKDEVTEPCHQGTWVTTAFVKNDGTYTTPKLISGDYLLQSFDSTAPASVHVNEWYSSDPNPHYLCSEASKITVGAADQTGKNFVLDDQALGAITGKVFKADGLTSLANINVRAYSYWDSYASCKAGDALGNPVTSAADGSFTISNVSNGYYLIKAYDDSETYQTEWYTGLADPSDSDCSKATKILVQGNTVADNNFQLAEASHRTITGNVAVQGGTVKPGTTIFINVYQCTAVESGKCTAMGRWVTSALVTNGEYKTDDIDTATYGTDFILQSYSMPQPSYMNEWHTSDGAGSYYWYNADVVSLSSGVAINKNFNLDLD